MRRSGFTMVELIFVIVIIGILAATALPKFSGVKDRAKVNSELSAMSGLDGAITAKIEFQQEDYNNRDIDWYDLGSDANATSLASIQTALETANRNSTILKKIAKKVRNLKVIAVTSQDENGLHTNTNGVLYFSPVLITGPASDSTSGVGNPTDHDGQDIPGKPDKNDFWVFNPSNYDLDINGTAVINATTIESGSIGLVDVNGTASRPTAGNIRYSNGTTPNGYFSTVN